MKQIETTDQTTPKRARWRSKKVLLPAVAAIAVLGVGGGVTAVAVADEHDSQVSGADHDRAAKAALAEVGDGKVSDVERGDEDDREAYDVEVTRPDGSEVDVALDAKFEPRTTTREDVEDRDDANDRGDRNDNDRNDNDGAADRDDRDVPAADRTRAEKAATAAVPGTVVDVDASDGKVGKQRAAYEVEVRTADGVEWNVRLDATFGVLDKVKDD